MSWDPERYREFAAPRQRPGFDLIARLPDMPARRIVDLGCGTGELTAVLARRWPRAEVTGLDSSAAMLARAAAEQNGPVWVEADIAAWAPAGPVDILFSNAALQWLDDHARLLPRLAGWLAPGGVLAVQMPRNFDAPSHRLMRETAAEGPWAGRIALRERPVLAPAEYYDLLAPHLGVVDIWETEYLHVLAGEAPVLDWVHATALRPVLAALDGAEREAFLAAYGARLAAAYPRRADGTTLFPFRRLFIVARR